MGLATPHSLEADQEGKNRVCQALVDANCLFFGKIIPAISIVPFYPETRYLFSSPKLLRIIAEEVAKLITQLNIDQLAGCEFAGVPLATMVSQAADMPVVFLRKQPKSYGTKSAIVGKVVGSRAVLIDDATGQGEGKQQFAGYLAEVNVKVTDMVVIYWTGHPLIDWYEQNGIEHHQLITFADFAHYAEKVGYISSTLHDMIWDWYQDYNINKRSLDFKRHQTVIDQAKREGFPIINDKITFEEIVAQSKAMGKWSEPPGGTYEYL